MGGSKGVKVSFPPLLRGGVTPLRHAGTMAIKTSPSQLDLFPAPTLPARFRLDDDTVKRGIRHIAEIRRMLAESPRRFDADLNTPVPRRQQDPPRAA